MHASKRIALLLPAAMALSACDAMMYKPFAPGNALNHDGTFLGGRPTDATLSAGDYGYEPDIEDAKRMAQEWLQAHLKDPESARYTWQGFGRGYVKDGLVYGGALNFGYMLVVGVNAKNSFGGYTGSEPWEFLFHNGQIIRIRHDGVPVPF